MTDSAGNAPIGSPPEADEGMDAPPEAAQEPIAEQPKAASLPAKAGNRVIATIEAILFSSDSPLTAAKIAQAAELSSTRAVKEAVETLNARYEQVGSAFRIEHIAGGYQMLTQSQFGDVLARLSRQRSESRLTQASLETLAIVAYRQPILRADVEAIRGVACGELLRGLLEKQLIRIAGRAQVLGRPLLYGTTRRFLELFGLASLEDLPKVEELRSGAVAGRPPAASQQPPSPAAGPAPPQGEPAQEAHTLGQGNTAE
jgi:segregation and condensation protein B